MVSTIRVTTRRRPRPPSSHDRHLSRRPASRNPSPAAAPLPPLALAPTIYTLSGIFDEPLVSSSDPSLPSRPPHSSSATSLLPSPSLRGKAKALFTGHPIYHSPASLGYALPPIQSNKHTEVAFLGRSNVGKSSLVAALLGGGNKGGERGGSSGGGQGEGKAHSQLVRTSKTPGCTQTLNLYSLQGHSYFYLVDLPGYGFARAGEGRREDWMETTLSYMQTRGLDVLKRTLLLVDARRGVMKQDELAMDLFDDHAVPYQIVLTKMDALRSQAARIKTLTQVLHTCTQRRHTACWPVVYTTSSKTGEGVQELRECLAGVVYNE
ncbi:hypothetical protein VYU27_009401 [Nannochloropsis oceanica]